LVIASVHCMLRVVRSSMRMVLVLVCIPTVVFAATLGSYVHATLWFTGALVLSRERARSLEARERNSWEVGHRAGPGAPDTKVTTAVGGICSHAPDRPTGGQGGREATWRGLASNPSGKLSM
jgi:hypothetical protein